MILGLAYTENWHAVHKTDSGRIVGNPEVKAKVLGNEVTAELIWRGGTYRFCDLPGLSQFFTETPIDLAAYRSIRGKNAAHSDILSAKEISHEIAAVCALYRCPVVGSTYYCAELFAAANNKGHKVRRTNIVQCLEESGGHVERLRYHRSAESRYRRANPSHHARGFQRERPGA